MVRVAAALAAHAFPPAVASRRMRLHRHTAAYAPDTARPICPRCWSRLDLDWGKGRDVASREMRGWGLARAEHRAADGSMVTVTTAVHRCANLACPTAIEISLLLAGGYVPELVNAHRLRDADAARFLAGSHTRAGIWQSRRGDPRTAPPQRDLFGG